MEPLTSLLFAAAVAAGPAPASPEAVVATTDRMSFTAQDQAARLSSNFPNERFRMLGSESAADGDWDDALRLFTQAARYADKYSQHRISLMYWHGAGVARDPALAYAWADLAAERMYPSFVVLREKIWLALSAAEREKALREGEALYAQYGDKVAKPRLAAAILRQNTQVTGTRTGQINGQLSVHAPGSANVNQFDGTSYRLTSMYADWRVNPEHYWAVEDAIWKDGAVDVGPAGKANPE